MVIVKQKNNLMSTSSRRNTSSSAGAYRLSGIFASSLLWIISLPEGATENAQRHPKLVGTDGSESLKGHTTAASGDGLTACVGGQGDAITGAVWFYTREIAVSLTW